MMWRTPPQPVMRPAGAGGRPRRSQRIRDRRRERLVAALRSVARQAGAHAKPRRGDLLLRERAAAVRPQLLEVAATLERAPDPPPEVMQTLRRLLTDGCTSPLWNEDVPAGELAAALEQARAELNWAELGDRGGPVVPLPTARPLSARAQRLRAGATPHAWHHITRDVGGR